MDEEELTPEQVKAAHDAWLARQDMITTEELRAYGLDPDDPDLLKLDGRHGPRWADGPYWFAFQIVDGTVPEIVRKVNRLLSPPDCPSPGAAAAWWLLEHGNLGARPVDFVGKPADFSLEEVVRNELNDMSG